MITFIILAGATLVILVGGLIVKKWLRGEEALLFCRCHACHEKIRFSADQAGRSGNCPKCQKRWTVPAPGAANQSLSGTAFTQPKPRVVIARKFAESR